MLSREERLKRDQLWMLNRQLKKRLNPSPKQKYNLRELKRTENAAVYKARVRREQDAELKKARKIKNPIEREREINTLNLLFGRFDAPIVESQHEDF